MPENYIHLLLGVFGAIAHTLLKYNELKNKATAANVKFDFSVYLASDWTTVALSFVAVGLWLFLFGDVALKYPALANYERASFAGMGFLGSYIIQYIGSSAQKKITAIIDAKTTILDRSNKPETDINSIIKPE
jgi:hypothetical protein